MYVQGERSKEIFAQSRRFIPGGVNSPFESFCDVQCEPFVAERGLGAYLYDVDGNEYIDYSCSRGALILGHSDVRVLSSVKSCVERGLSFGVPSQDELTLAELIVHAVPGAETVRLVSSETQGIVNAVRLARGYTGRQIVLKFDGCYHGDSDIMLAENNHGEIKKDRGLPPPIALGAVNLPYNSFAAVNEIFDKYGDDIAAVVVEPVAAKAGLIMPDMEFLTGLRYVTAEHGAVLIFDETVTGFRLSYGGAQKYFGVEPDLTVLGSIIGGGMPLAAVCGKKEITEYAAPLGSVWFEGTVCGNPAAVSAGIKTLEILKDSPEIYSALAEKTQWLAERMRKSINKYEIQAAVNCCGSMLSVFWGVADVKDCADVKASDKTLYAKYFSEMLVRRVFLPPSQLGTMFISAAHTSADLEKTAAAFEETLEVLKAEKE